MKLEEGEDEEEGKSEMEGRNEGGKEKKKRWMPKEGDRRERDGGSCERRDEERDKERREVRKMEERNGEGKEG